MLEKVREIKGKLTLEYNYCASHHQKDKRSLNLAKNPPKTSQKYKIFYSH